MAELDAKATTTAETWLVYDRDDERTLKPARELVGKTLDCMISNLTMQKL